MTLLATPTIPRSTETARFLPEQHYVERAESAMLPTITSDVLTEFVESSQQLPRREWLRQVRAWALAAV